ncbi:MAG: aminomethyltransferase family protein [Acidobacteriota bacterium]|nr:aminomethyltransferase family protein [Acidobacteriota bacterium]MDH3524300.1 aminomethyltransferase family protein [Acidobacteriota bacterium]
MPEPSVFHSRTAQLCTSHRWKDWGGYYAVCSYDMSPEPEYQAFRHSAGLIDVSPLFKYEIAGPDAAAFLSRLTVKDATKLRVGRVTYLCWCDDDGKVIDDGTLSRLGEEHFRLTAAEPSLHWLASVSRGFRVTIEDSSARLGTLALQGPESRRILERVTDVDLAALKFFRVAAGTLAGVPVWISRTGYTGDLGYEIWVGRDGAERVYDAITEAGRGHGLLPAGLDALDVARIEAGFVMNGVDYFSAHHCLTESRKSSPFELGLGWTVQLDRGPFVGQAALAREKQRGPRRAFVGLDVSWAQLEEVFARYGLPPELSLHAWRDGRPVYDGEERWIGQATSGAWSPTLKKNLALALLPAGHAATGTPVRCEVTAEYRRHTVAARVVKPPFFDPERKRA